MRVRSAINSRTLLRDGEKRVIKNRTTIHFTIKKNHDVH
jgi:hypothetical protein